MREIFTLIILLLSLFMVSQAKSSQDSILNKPETKVFFVENNALDDPRILFSSMKAKHSTRFLENGISFGMKIDSVCNQGNNAAVWNINFNGQKNVNLIGAGKDVPKISRIKSEGKNELSSFEELWYENVYEGIDYRFYGLENGLIEYDILIEAGADPKDVLFELNGVKNLDIENDGSVSYQVGEAKIFGGKPIAYQLSNGVRTYIEVEYQVFENQLSYRLGDYDSESLLVIDPVLEFSTFIGGTGTDEIRFIFEDGDHFYGCGTSSSSNFPVDPGAYQLNHAGAVDLVFCKMDTLGFLLEATYLGGQWLEYINNCLFVNGEFLVLGGTTSNDFPQTTGSVMTWPPTAFQMGFFVKMDNSLDLVYSSYVGGDMENVPYHLVHNPISNMVYGQGLDWGASFTSWPISHPALSMPVIGPMEWVFRFDNSTNLMPFRITSSLDFFIGEPVAAVVTPSGGVAICGQDPGFYGLPSTPSALPATPTASTAHIMVLDASDNLEFAGYLGGSNWGLVTKLIEKNNRLYALGLTYADDYPVSSGAFQPIYGGQGDVFVHTLDLASNSVLYSSFLGGALDEYIGLPGEKKEYVDDNHNLYMMGKTGSSDFPVTPGAFQTSKAGSFGQDVYVTKIDASGNVVFSTYIGSPDGNDEMLQSFVDNAGVTLIGQFSNAGYPTTPDAFENVYKGNMDIFYSRFSGSGNLDYSSYLSGINNEGIWRCIKSNGSIYVLGQTDSPDFSTSAGAVQTSFAPFSDLFVTKFNASHQVAFSTYLGGASSETPFEYYGNSNFQLEHNGNIHLLTNVNGTTFTTGDAIQPNYYPSGFGTDVHYSVLNATTGALEFATHLGGVDEDKALGIFAFGKSYYLFGEATDGFPITEGAYQEINGGGKDWFMSKFNGCYEGWQTDSIIPDTQLLCRNSTADPLTAAAFVYDSLPTIMAGADVFPHPNPSSEGISYEWEVSIDGGVSWAPAPGGVGQNYSPPELSDTTWYRRLIFNCCGDTLGISDTSVINILSDLAPVADAGDSLYICEGGSIELGELATGGLGPYEYGWTPNVFLTDDSIYNPVANPPTSSVYVVEVTDARGCTHKDQVSVHVIKANAGPDKINCAGQGVQIGGTPWVGLSGLTYSWTPVATLSDPNVALPIANPVVTTTYYLTLTGPDGCPSIDSVIVTPISFPPSPSDVTICEMGSSLIGSSPQAGFSYYWSPSTYLDDPNIAQPTFYSVDIAPSNPLVYSLQIVENISGCVQYEEINVYVNYVRGAGGCTALIGGTVFPLMIGPDDLNGGLSTFEWSVISGDPTGGFLTDSLATPVVVSPSIATVYQLESILNGVSCTWVYGVGVGCPGGSGSGGGACPLDTILVSSNVGCAIADTAQGTVLVAANPDLIQISIDTNLFFGEWSPTTDLATPDSTATGFTGNFTGMRWYYYTIYSVFDSAVLCLDSIPVFGENTVIPTGNAQDSIICEGESAVIGNNVFDPNMTYTWSPELYLDDPSSENPVSTPSGSIQYTLVVTDINTGCQDYDTCLVIVRQVGPDAGEDLDFCDGAIVTLGTPPLPDRTYSWQPAIGLFPSDVPQPTDTLYGTTEYIVTVTDTTTGCSLNDTVIYTEIQSPVLDIISTVEDLCAGGTIVLSPDSVYPEYNYGWSPTTGLDDPSSGTVEASPLNSTVYELTAVDGNALGCFASDQVQVNVSTDPAPFIDAGPDTNICMGSSVILGTPDLGYTYSWTPVTGLDDPNIAQPTATPLSNITYTLSVTDGLGCVSMDQVSIVLFVAEPWEYINLNSCLDSDITIGEPSQSGFLYNWTPGGSFPNPNLSQQFFSPTISGEYYLQITNEGGCSWIDTFNIMVLSATVDAGLDQTICGTPTLIGTPGIGGYFYTWSPSHGLDNPNIPQPLAMPSVPINYIVTATAPNGCSRRDTVLVEPEVPLSPFPDVNVCPGGNVLLGFPDPGGLTYNWSPNYMIDNQSIAQPSVSPLIDTVYTVEVVNGGCIFRDTIEVDVNDLVVDAGNPTVLCPDMCMTIGPPSVNGFSYQWSPSTSLSDPNIAQPTACPSTAINYTLLITEVATGCQATDDLLLDVNNSVTPSVNAGSNLVICPGESVALGMAPQASICYSWIPMEGVESPFNALTDASPFSSQLFILTAVNDTSFCSSSDSVYVEVAPTPVPPTMTDQTICSGSQTQIGTADSDLSFQWVPSMGLNNDTISNPIASPADTTIYTVIVTDENGCSSSSSLTVNVAPGTNVTADAGTDLSICRFDSVILGTPDAGGGIEYVWTPALYLNDDSIAQPNIGVSGFGTNFVYTLTATLGPCSSVDIVELEVLPEVLIEAGEDQIICGTTTNLNGVGVLPATGTWSLASGPNSPLFSDVNFSSTSISGLIPGTYNFEWSVEGALCNPGSDLVQVIVKSPPLLSVTDPGQTCPMVDLTHPSVTLGSSLGDADLTYWLDSNLTIPIADPTSVNVFGTYYISAVDPSTSCNASEAVNVDIFCNNPLDLEYLNFNAEKEGTHVRLMWEINISDEVSRFEIEKSVDGASFQLLGSINDVGIIEGTRSFESMDYSPVQGNNYYRIKIVQVDGSFFYSQMRMVSFDLNSSFVVFPNPSQDGKFNIQFSRNLEKDTQIEIYNIHGQMVDSKELSANSNLFHSLDCSGLASGTYFLRLDLKGENITTKLIIY